VHDEAEEVILDGYGWRRSVGHPSMTTLFRGTSSGVSYLEWKRVSWPSRSGNSSFSRTSSISMSEISTPKSLTSHVSYLSGITLMDALGGRGRFAGDDTPSGTAWPSPCLGVCCRRCAWPPSSASCAGTVGCGSVRREGSGGSVAVVSAEVSPRWRCTAVRDDVGGRIWAVVEAVGGGWRGVGRYVGG